MWKSRIQQAVAAVTPIQIEVTTVLHDLEAQVEIGTVVDLRGHHLGVDRAKVAAT
jgi:phenylacetate-CoA ligase